MRERQGDLFTGDAEDTDGTKPERKPLKPNQIRFLEEGRGLRNLPPDAERGKRIKLLRECHPGQTDRRGNHHAGRFDEGGRQDMKIYSPFYVGVTFNRIWDSYKGRYN